MERAIFFLNQNAHDTQHAHTHPPHPHTTQAGQHLTPKEQALGVFEIDLSPFARGVPFLTRPQSIGSGALFLNRHLATALTAPGGPGPAPLYDYLVDLTLDGTPVMINGRIASAAALPRALARALGWLAAQPPDTPWVELADRLQEMGFEPGWGTTAGTVSQTMDLLSDVLEAADPDRLADFLARVPSITRVALITPHGFFGQANVLGKPDTGGQVVYILDQTRALEAEMAARLAAAGLAAVPRIVILTRLIPDAGNTTCDVRLEKVAGTEHAVILRVPFRNGGGVVRPWISRFDVWPYLEGFAVDAASDLAAHLGGPPQLIVGNYSDGNLVASLLANHFDAPHFSIAHALEKSKYRDLWRWSAPQHAAMHADVQITADLLAMARADCIITCALGLEGWRGRDERASERERQNDTPTPPTLHTPQTLSHLPRDSGQVRLRHRGRPGVGGPVRTIQRVHAARPVSSDSRHLHLRPPLQHHLPGGRRRRLLSLRRGRPPHHVAAAWP